jgi:hypothetical protein
MEVSTERAAEYEEQGKEADKSEMRDEILRIIDLKINELSRFNPSNTAEAAISNIQIEALQEVYAKIERL